LWLAQWLHAAAHQRNNARTPNPQPEWADMLLQHYQHEISLVTLVAVSSISPILFYRSLASPITHHPSPTTRHRQSPTKIPSHLARRSPSPTRLRVEKRQALSRQPQGAPTAIPEPTLHRSIHPPWFLRLLTLKSALFLYPQLSFPSRLSLTQNPSLPARRNYCTLYPTTSTLQVFTNRLSLVQYFSPPAGVSPAISTFSIPGV
jgi:hypothetical protein